MSVYTPSFSRLFNGRIWKIIADNDSGVLFIESRDGEKRKAIFSCIDIGKKQVLWSDQSILDPWWSSLKTAEKGNVLIVKFNDPDMPEQRGFTVIEGSTGKLKWGSEEAQVMHVESDGILISEVIGEDESSYSKLNWNTGEIMRSYTMKELFATFNKKSQQPSVITYPFHFEEENSFFTKIQEYIEILTKQKAIRMIEYLEKGDKVLISYYIYIEEKLTNLMLVADEKGALLFHEELQTGLTGIGMDTFFVVKDQLIIVKNNNELQAYVIK
jgi:hypothetical protein